MSVSTNQASVATTGATLIAPAGAAGTVPQTALVVANHDATNPVFVGGASVTTATGLRIAAGQVVNLGHVDGSALYGVATGAAVTVSYFTTT